MSESTKPPPSNAKRVLGIVGGVIVVSLLGWIFLRKPIQWSTWIHDARTDREARKRLREETDPALVSTLESALADTDRPRDTRAIVGQLLIEKENRAIVERALTASSLDLRTVAIEVLARESFFQKQYADDPAYRVHETLLEWLKDGSRTDRVRAIAVLPVVYPYDRKMPDEVRSAVRAMLSAPGPTIRHNAAASLAGYRDCDSARAIVEMAAKEDDAEAKLRLMQIVVQQFWDAGGDACRAAMSEDAVKALVVRGLAHQGAGDVNNDSNRAVRTGAMLLLSRHPDWAKESADTMRAILDSKVHEVERRQALDTLASAGDAKTLGRIPAFFHDASGGVRSSAAKAVGDDKPSGVLGLSQHAIIALLSGYFSAESDVKGYEARLRLAYSTIRQKAGVWVGLPEPLRTKGGSMNEIAEPIHKLLTTGSFEGTTRAQVAEALFRWLATEEKLSADEIEAAVKARAEFWSKAFAGDASGAKKVYESAVGSKPDLWIYEKGFLMAKGAI